MRLVFVALAILGLAAPAGAGERAVPGAEADALALLMADHRATARAYPDTLALLMADHRVTAGALAERPVVAVPVSYDLRAFALTLGELETAPALSRFEALAGARAAFEPGGVPIDELRIDASEPDIVRNGARDVVGEGVVRRGAPLRRKTLLAGSVTLHLDGREASPSLTTGGAAAVLNVVPR